MRLNELRDEAYATAKEKGWHDKPQSFNRLTIVDKLGLDAQSHRYVKVRCECGEIFNVRYDSLTSGNTKSCGCLNRELSGQRLSAALFKHGKAKTRIFKTWAGMKQRCSNENDSSFKYYGARGVKVCVAWRDFETFYSWSQVSGYSDNLTIDRIDPSKDYSPENCRWITRQAQGNNKRNSPKLTLEGKIITFKELADRYGVNYHMLYQQRKRLNWPDSLILERLSHRHGGKTI